MPPKKYPRVELAVQGAIHDAIQKHLLRAADDHLAGGGLDAGLLRTLRPTAAYWTIARNKDRISYCLAFVRLSDGTRLEYAWRVPYEAPLGRGGRLFVLPAQYVTLETYRSKQYALGARAGSGASGRHVAAGRSRSRPEVGRAYKSSARKRRSR